MNRSQRRKQINKVKPPKIKEMTETEKILRRSGLWDEYKREYEKVFLSNGK
jgi:hypothetical protein